MTKQPLMFWKMKLGSVTYFGNHVCCDYHGQQRCGDTLNLHITYFYLIIQLTVSPLVHRQAPSTVLAGVGDFYVGLQPRY